MSFIFGAGAPARTPQEAARMRATTDAIAARLARAPKDVGEGLSAVGNALVARSIMDRASAGEEAGQAQVAEMFKGLSDGADQNELMTVLGNEWASPAQSAVAQALLNRQFAAEDRANTPDWQTFESGGDVYRFNANDPESTPGMFFDGPAAPIDAPTVTESFDPETGRPRKQQWNGATGQWEELGGVSAPDDPLVTVNTGEGSDAALDKALSGEEGKVWAEYKKQGTVSGAMGQDFAVLDELMKVAPQGPVTGRLAEMFKGFSSAGDAFQSIVKRNAPALRVPGSGATSDIEYQGMLDSLPSLSNSAEGNAMILSIMKAKTQLNMERSEIITKYQNGDIEIGEARREMNRLDRVSIITPEMKEALLGVGVTEPDAKKDTPSVGDVVEGYRYKGGDPASPTSWEKL